MSRIFSFLACILLIPPSTIQALRDGPGGTCGDAESDIWSDIIRINLDSNIWASSEIERQLRGPFIWLGPSYSSFRNDIETVPLVTLLSTKYNNTYVSNSSAGTQPAPCPNSYIFESSCTGGGWNNCPYTAGPWMTCYGYYNISPTVTFSPENQTNFTGSLEQAAESLGWSSDDILYGREMLDVIMPETYGRLNVTDIGFASTSNMPIGFVTANGNQRIGLGLNSTFLNTLYNAQFIASKSVGLYYGIPVVDVERAPSSRNGSLVIGGYSRKRLLGNFSVPGYPIATWELERPCPWVIHVDSISSGESANVGPLSACLEPDEPNLVLPSQAIDALNQTLSSGATITLNNGLVVAIPPSLVSFRATDDEDKSPIIGVPFLTQTYVFADYQTLELNIGLANNEPSYFNERDELQCIEHAPSIGPQIPWAVSSTTGATSSSTNEAPSTTTHRNSAVRTRNSRLPSTLYQFIGVLAFLYSTGVF